MLRSFVRQLSLFRDNHQDLVRSSIIQLYHEREKKGFASEKIDMNECQALFSDLMNAYPHITIVLDALDECDKGARTRFLDILNSLVLESSSSLIKILISSRPDEDIVHRFGCGPNVEIRATDNHEDIIKFVYKEIHESPWYLRDKVDLSLRNKICETLIAQSNGM